MPGNENDEKSKSDAVRLANISHSEALSSGSARDLGIVVLAYTVLIAVSLYATWRVPVPLASNANTKYFSEGRALQHVERLTDFGIRVVGHPELDAAAEYLLQEGHELVSTAKRTRPDLLVQVQRELVSGAVETEFLHTGYTNLYNNITNIILVVSPTAALHEKSVLVNAHFDSTLGTTGASDDASCVGIVLELARMLISNPEIQLAAPVIFLMNGAEEALCPASHGFMQQSPWAKDAGVFLNLESTGPLGPDFLFQQTGEWPMKAFVKAAPYPRGSVVAQDFFQLGLMPADTDYRMFSANLQGSLPGLDTAMLLGAGMYHTDRDSMENLRPGTLQSMGDNALAVLVEFGNQLALRRHQNKTELDTEKVIFLDVLGLFMVMYPFRWAHLVHHVPLLLTLSLPFIQRSGFQQHASLPQLYASLAGEALAAILSMVGALASCILVSILRVVLLGNPMAWYGHDALPFAILVPAGAAGLLLPYLGRKVDPKLAALGNIVTFSGVASWLTQAGLGMSAVGTIWALAGLFALSDLEATPAKLLKVSAVVCLLPVTMFMPNAIALSTYVMQKASFMGAQGKPAFSLLLADGVAGLLVGMVVISVTGFLVPWLAFACGRLLKRVVVTLYTLSFLAAVSVSLVSRPYTRLAPKKIFLQHLHEHDAAGTLHRSVFAIGAVDSVPVDKFLETRMPAVKYERTSGWEWQVFLPFDDKYISGKVVKAPSLGSGGQLPSIQLVTRQQRSAEVEEVVLQPKLPGPGYIGSINITGPILDWSLPKTETPAQNKGATHSRLVRFVGTGPEANMRFSIHVPSNSKVKVRLAAAHTAKNQEIESFTSEWPDWTFTAKVTTFVSEYEF